MSTVLKVNPRVTRLVNYIKEIEEGKIQIPSFQRDFVWGKKEKIELFESLKLGYPIGSLLLWKPKETFNIKDEIGPYIVPVNHSGNDYFYILDGFQRLSTLFGCLINPNTTSLERNESELIKDFNLFYDLENEEFTFPRSTPTDLTLIPVNSLIDTYEFLNYVEKLRNSINNEVLSTTLIDRARVLSSAILDYMLPSVEINGGTIEDAVDIFSRINSKGSKISSDWMVSALTYNEKQGFRLGTVIDDLIEELKSFNYGKIKRETILQCIQSSFGKLYFDEKIAELVKKPNFIDVTNSTVRSIVKTVRFLFEELLVIDYKLLPYNSQLIFISYFFTVIEEPSFIQLKELKKWFWKTTYSNYFTIYSLSKQRQAFFQFQAFVHGVEDDPLFNDKPNIAFAVPEFPKSIYFGSVRAKALILFLLNYSNDFKGVKIEEIDEVKIGYLFSNHVCPEGVVPFISYLPEFAEKNALSGKHKDLSYLFDYPAYLDYLEKFLITERMFDNYIIDSTEQILMQRKSLIFKKEKEFVTKLGLTYE